MRYIVSIVCLLCCTFSLHAMDAEFVIQKIIDQRALVKDWSAVYSQKMTGFGQDSVEMGRITVKGDNVRKDIQRPIRRIRIQTPMLVMEKDEVSGEVITSDLSQKSGVMGMLKMTPEEALAKISFQVASENKTEIIMDGTLDSVRIQMTVDAIRFVPLRMTMSLPGGAEMRMAQTYDAVAGISVLTASDTQMVMMMGARRETMSVNLVYRNVKVNQGVEDAVFRL